ncbi:MAG: family 16 glycosylhydrolase [Candidatus Cryptobacteroides sp.]
MRRLAFLFIFMSLMTISCKGEKTPSGDGPGITVSPASLSFTAEGGTKVLDLNAEGDWGVSVADKSVCTVSPEYGSAGSYAVEVTMQPNKRYETVETGVTFMHGVGRTTVTVCQEAAEKPVIEDPDIVAPEGYSLVWHDEFDSEPKDSGNWRFENWAPGRVNNELQRYVAGGELDGKKTAHVEDGVLFITAMQHGSEVISARMNSTASWKYGYMEARIRLPKGKGTWPAFWMMPDDQSLGWPSCGEIDIMEEVGVNPNYTSSSIHTKAYNHVQNTQKTKEIYTAGAEDSFHTYACEWTEESLKFYTDGVQFFEFRNDGKSDNDTWPFNKAFYITLNLAWGGDWGGWNGVDPSALPTSMEIDYVRVFQKL